MHHPRRRNVTTSMVGLKMVTYTKISPKMVSPTDISGECRRRRITNHKDWRTTTTKAKKKKKKRRKGRLNKQRNRHMCRLRITLVHTQPICGWMNRWRHRWMCPLQVTMIQPEQKDSLMNKLPDRCVDSQSIAQITNSTSRKNTQQLQ